MSDSKATDYLGFGVVCVVLMTIILFAIRLTVSLILVVGSLPSATLAHEMLEQRKALEEEKLTGIEFEYVRKGLNSCLVKRTNQLFSPFAPSGYKLAGITGFATPFPEEVAPYLDEIYGYCTKDFVVSAPTFKEAISRNQLLSKAQINPFDMHETQSLALFFGEE
jgi:hypothetical protein